MKHPYIFGIRHLSPAGAWHLLKFLEEKKPKLVLIEGPTDFNDQIKYLTYKSTEPPVALLAYTKEAPVRTILYPLAEYSPEYQAIVWCKTNKVECLFCDLPSDVFLAMPAGRKTVAQGEEETITVYERLDRYLGEDGHDTFWERTLEHTLNTGEYHEAANLFGENLRSCSEGSEADWEEILLRESYMRREIAKAVTRGIDPENIVVVTGAYHVKGLSDPAGHVMTEEERWQLPREEIQYTMMPYSYYKLSIQSGYGAGNRAPAYYGMLWEALKREDISYAAQCYMTKLAEYYRMEGNMTSAADVIEAVRLAGTLARMRGGRYPALRDLRDAAITCIGRGDAASIRNVMMVTEIENKLGGMPKGVSRTSIQDDFYRQLKELQLEKYYQGKVKKLQLDLRENISAEKEENAFLDLHRSNFLHQLNVLDIPFGRKELLVQEDGTWSEQWNLEWMPEMEIKLVESALRGDTVRMAAAFLLRKQAEKATEAGKLAGILERAFECGISEAVEEITKRLQALAVEAVSMKELTETAHRLSAIIRYGTVRRLDAEPLKPLLRQIFYRFCLLLPENSNSKKTASVISDMELLDRIVEANDCLEDGLWLQTVKGLVTGTDVNAKIAGFALALLLEHGIIGKEELSLEIGRRLSPGVSVDSGAGWFEGFSMKNHAVLIAKMEVWSSLDDYIIRLDEDEFKRALVVLRRAFSGYSADEKMDIAENLRILWGLDSRQVSELTDAANCSTQELSPEDQQFLEDLLRFEFEE